MHWFLVIEADGTHSYINLEQVRQVENIGPGACELIFSETHRCQLQGPAADEVVHLLAEIAQTIRESE